MLNEPTHPSEKNDLKSILSLRFERFDTSSPGAKSSLCEKAYLFWRQQWDQTFQELQVDKQNWSDDFLNRELVGLFDNEEPVGLMLYRFLDLSRPSHRAVSYFHNYPPEVMAQVQAPRDTVQVPSHMTVNPNWTKTKTDYPISELLISFCVLGFLENLQAQRMLGYLRKNRSTHSIFYRHGAIAVANDVQAYNVKVDFAIIPRQTARLSTLTNCDQLALYFWNQQYNTIKRIYDYQPRPNKNINEAFGRQRSPNELGEHQFL